MKKLWIYIFFSPITKTIEEGKPIKEPYVWAIDCPDADYSEITNDDILVSQIKDLYYKYEVDGIEYTRTLRAELVLEYHKLILTELDVYEIEDILKSVFASLILGDWMTAKYQMSLIAPTPPLEQAFYDEILQYITNYIAENY